MPSVGRNHLCRHQTTLLSWILKNSREFSSANENEQNRFLTLRAVEILISNGVYREKLHFSRIRNYEITNSGCLLTLVDDHSVGRNDLRRPRRFSLAEFFRILANS